MNDKYHLIQLESEIMEANPHRLIQMMFEKCIQQIQFARHCMEENEIAKKGNAISKALDIVDYLKLMLNREAPEAVELSGQLDAVYTYINDRLIRANMKNDPAQLDDALRKINKIKMAWDTMGVEA